MRLLIFKRNVQAEANGLHVSRHKRRERSVYVQDSSEINFENVRSHAPFAGAGIERCDLGASVHSLSQQSILQGCLTGASPNRIAKSNIGCEKSEGMKRHLDKSI